MKSQSSIYRSYHRVITVIICIAMLASYFPKQVWDLLFTQAYAAPITILPPTTPISPLAPSALGMASPVNQMLQSADLPDEFSELSQMGLLTPNGEPNGMLMDLGAMQSAIQTTPASLVNPLSISRVQSAYRAADVISNTLVITFTVTNNRPPAITPPTLPVSATITDTMNFVSALDFSNDPNTIRNVLLTNELTSIESFVEASHPAERNRTQLAFNLGHITPLSSVSMTLSIEVPSDVTDFTELDSGAKVWGTLQSQMVEAQAYPATLAPDTIDGQPIGEWLKWTVDADFHDEYMLEQAAELGQDPIAMFEYVRSLGYESYKGSLRGTRGTLWSEAGNSLDQASLLIAMLRASGIPARYRHGTLETAQAQELILSMFPEPTQVIGHIPAGTELSDPANDPQLLDETQNHWWVEAYIPASGWQDLDPSFASAVIGQSFVPAGNVATDGTDRIAEVPDSLRHKVTMKVKVETFYSLSSLNGDLAITYPLTATFNTVELVGEPVTLNHLVNSTGEGGFAFGVIRHSYTPLLLIGDQIIQGQTYQEMMTNFPFGNVFVAGEWLILQTRAPDGEVETYEREIYDAIGVVVRQNGGHASIAEGRDNTAYINSYDAIQLHIISQNRIPVNELAKQWTELGQLYSQLGMIFNDIQRISDEDVMEAFNFISQNHSKIDKSSHKIMLIMSYLHLLCSEKIRNYYNKILLSKSYVSSPNFVLLSQTNTNNTTEMTFELVKVRENVVISPYQNQSASWALIFFYSTKVKETEHKILNNISGETPISIISINNAAVYDNIEMVSIVRNNIDKLDIMDISEQAKARIMEAVNEDKIVTMPSKMVSIGGKQTIGWWETDSTGYTVGVIEEGKHAGLFSYAMTVSKSSLKSIKALASKSGAIYTFYSFIRNLFITVGFVGHTINGMLMYIGIDLSSILASKSLAQVNLIAAFFMTLIEISILCHVDANQMFFFLPPYDKDFCIGAVFALAPLSVITSVIFIGTYINFEDPPLPGLRFFIPSNIDTLSNEYTDIKRVAFQSTQTGTKVTGDLNISVMTIQSLLRSHWESSAQYSIIFREMFLSEARLYSFEGNQLADGNLEFQQLSSIKAQTQNELLHFTLTGPHSASYYAPALSGLGAGGEWITYTAQLTSTEPYTLTLEDAIVTVNGTETYTGSFTIVTTDTTYLEGSGHTAMPNFAESAYMEADDGRLMIGPATGTALVGDEALDVSNGLALAGYSGPITVTEATSDTDLVELAGDASFFTLRTEPSSTTTDPVTPVNFAAQVDANFSDSYTVTVEGPPGWDVDLSATGQITATPPLGAQPGEYTILVTAQSEQYPDLFVSALHTVTTTDYQGMEFSVEPDELITVPWGDADPNALPGDTNNGQAQMPEAAYTANITNTSTTEHTFEVTVTGLPEGWLVMSGAEGQTQKTMTLPPGGIGEVGLYISPTVEIFRLRWTSVPPPGTEFPFTVSVVAVDAPTLTTSESVVFTVPEVSFSHLTTSEPLVYSSPGYTTTFDLTLRNVGNVAGYFDILVTQPITSWNVDVTSPLIITPGQGVTQELTLETPEGDVGRSYAVSFSSPSQVSALGIYTQTASVLVQITTPEALCVHKAARAATQLGDTEVAAALSNLALAIEQLQALPESTVRLSGIRLAMQELVTVLEASPDLLIDDLSALSQDWLTTPSFDLIAQLGGLCGQLCRLSD